MAEVSESNSLELRIAFHNAVSRFQAWTADVGEPRVKLRGRFCPISEVCEAAIFAILYKETQKTDETYRGAGRRLLRLIERRKDEIRRRKTLRP